MRQYRVSHHLTGETFLVNGPEGHTPAHYQRIASQAGWRHLAECSVLVVPRGFETQLPWSLPLRVAPPWPVAAEVAA